MAAGTESAASRTSTANRGNAKLPPHRPPRLTGTHRTRLQTVQRTSSSIDTASRPSTFVAFACTSGVSYTFTDPWISSRLLNRLMPALVPLGWFSAASRASDHRPHRADRDADPGEHMADVGNVFLALAHQRRVLLARLAQRRQHNRAHLQGVFFMSGSVMSASNEPMRPSGFLAPQTSGDTCLRQVETRRVLDIALPRLERWIEIQLYVCRALPMVRLTSSITSPMMSSVALSLSRPLQTESATQER